MAAPPASPSPASDDAKRAAALAYVQTAAAWDGFEEAAASVRSCVKEGGATLYLTDCAAASHLPAELFVGLSATLEALHCDGSGFLSLPDTVSECAALKQLSMPCCTRISSLPEGLGSCSNLTSIDLASCDSFSSLPEGLGSCSNLASLCLSFCRELKALPESIGSCVALKKLDCRGSGLRALPKSIGDCAALEELRLSSCLALTTLPPEIRTCEALTTLTVSYTGLKILPPELGLLPKLSAVHFAGLNLEDQEIAVLGSSPSTNDAVIATLRTRAKEAFGGRLTKRASSAGAAAAAAGGEEE